MDVIGVSVQGVCLEFDSYSPLSHPPMAWLFTNVTLYLPMLNNVPGVISNVNSEQFPILGTLFAFYVNIGVTKIDPRCRAGALMKLPRHHRHLNSAMKSPDDI